MKDFSADVDGICWLLITVGNFTRTEWSVFAHVCVCVNTVFFAEGGTGELSDSAEMFVLVGAGSRLYTAAERWLQSQTRMFVLKQQEVTLKCFTVETVI